MTREHFVARAVRDEERRLDLPVGWWGTYREIYGPDGIRVRFSGQAWVVRSGDLIVSRHDSRHYAITKAKWLVSQEA